MTSRVTRSAPTKKKDRCIYCRNKRRRNQRTCKTCHAKRMVEYRLKQRIELLVLRTEQV